jgi:hypothetical protein
MKTRVFVSSSEKWPWISDSTVEETLETLLDIHQTSVSWPTFSKNIHFLKLISHSVAGPSFWLDRTDWDCDPKSRRYILSARLRALHGPTIDDVASTRARGAAREAVYRLSNYTSENDWGPVEKDGSGRVDWVLAEAAALVMRLNCIYANRDLSWAPAVPLPLGFDFSRTKGYARTEEEQDGDWAGVNDDWVGAYAFLGMHAYPWDPAHFTD